MHVLPPHPGSTISSQYLIIYAGSTLNIALSLSWSRFYIILQVLQPPSLYFFALVLHLHPDSTSLHVLHPFQGSTVLNLLVLILPSH